MNRINEVTFDMVDLLPSELADGVVYVSLEHRAIVHKCCCGCGERVVLNLSPAGWKVTLDGETISLCPSVGNGSLDCNSHYWIRNDRVEWSAPMTASETKRAQTSGRSEVAKHFEPPVKKSIWQRVTTRWRRQ
jgi:hypothetical protein